MQIRSISQNELPRFAEVSFPPSDTAAGQQIVADFWASGESRPAWCFVAEDGADWLGGVFYRKRGDGVSFYDLQINADQDYLAIGSRLLRDSLRQMYEQGVARFVRNFQTGENHVEKWRSLLDHLQIPLEQEKALFTWDADQPMPIVQQRLTYRSLAVVGEAAFVDALRRVTDATLDRGDQADRTKEGPQSHAQEYFDLLKHAFHSQPDWWALAYTTEDRLVGLHMPVLFDAGSDEGTIGYIGVVPEQRGQGYIHDVLARCTETLLNTGISSIVTDTDRLNVPMINAFRRGGYQAVGTVWAYAADLDTLFA